MANAGAVFSYLLPAACPLGCLPGVGFCSACVPQFFLLLTVAFVLLGVVAPNIYCFARIMFGFRDPAPLRLQLRQGRRGYLARRSRRRPEHEERGAAVYSFAPR